MYQKCLNQREGQKQILQINVKIQELKIWQRTMKDITFSPAVTMSLRQENNRIQKKLFTIK